MVNQTERAACAAETCRIFCFTDLADAGKGASIGPAPLPFPDPPE